ncbi:MAG: hypothetical protein AAF840_18620, partial [Bacteroidota bacterium]
MQASTSRKGPWLPSRNEVVGLLAFYFFFSFVYHVVVWYNSRGLVKDGPWGWLDMDHYWWTAGLSYTFCLLGSILIWCVGCYLLYNRRQWIQMLAVALLIPPVVYAIRAIRYAIIDYMGFGRLRGEGTIWDLYIPSLFL